MDQENYSEELSREDLLQSDIIRLGSAVTHSEKGSIHCLTIIGQIEGHILLPPNNKTTKYEHVMPMLASIEESDDIDALLILLNTVGGDIEAGLGIAELISGMKKPTASLVLGGGHSIFCLTILPKDLCSVSVKARSLCEDIRVSCLCWI